MLDLHFHSDESDGQATLATVLTRVAQSGLALVALADHDAIENATVLAGVYPGALVGVELTTFVERRRIDLLGIGLDPAYAPLRGYLSARRRERRARFELFGELLRADGWRFEPDDATLGRPQLAAPHVAAELRRHPDNLERLAAIGAQASPGIGTGDAIYTLLLDPLGPTLRERIELGVLSGADAIALVHASGGLAVVAHPWVSPYDRGHATKSKARRLLDMLVAAGLDGLELHHPDQTEPAVRGELAAYAAANGLLVSAGSDDHGAELTALGSCAPPDAPALVAAIGAALARVRAAR